MRYRSLADGRSAFPFRLPGLVLLAMFTPSASADQPPAPLQTFVRDYCTSCHNDVDKKGRLSLTSLAFDSKDAANLAVWIKVHDRVQAGEMPPKSRSRPDAARQKTFTGGL